MIGQWWADHGSKLPPPHMLPPTSLIVEVAGKPIASGFVYRTDSSIIILALVCYDRNACKEDRDTALGRMIEHVKLWTDHPSIHAVFCPVRVRRFEKRLKDAGFVDLTDGHWYRGKK